MLPSIVTDLARVNAVPSVAVTLDPCWESRLAQTDEGALAPCQLAGGSVLFRVYFSERQSAGMSRESGGPCHPPALVH